ncbi:hypothetical protein D9A28_02890 [Vibrio cholerae]|nr:hypothetical protein [Vibrio cholerae]
MTSPFACDYDDCRTPEFRSAVRLR